jgi:hypothetical protein
LCISYFSYATSTQIQVVDASSDGKIFPQVAFCSLNEYATPWAQVNLLERVREKYGNDVTTLADVLVKKNVMYTNYTDYLSAVRTHVATNLTVSQQKALGYSMNNTILKCEFSGESCNMSRIQWYFDSKRGNCYKYNEVFHLFKY